MSPPKPIQCAGRRRDHDEYIRRNSTTLRTGFVLFMSEEEQKLVEIEASELAEIMKIRSSKGYNAIMLLELREEE